MSPNRRALLATAGQTVVAAGAASLPSAAAAAPDVVVQLVRQAAQGHEALMRGDIAAYRSFIPLSGDFSLMAPFGGPPTRSGHYTEEQWAAIGAFFRNGRDSSFELVRAYRSPELVVLAAIERSHVEVGGLPAQDWALRVTLVFRKDIDSAGEGWLLAHRHADPLVAGISVAQSAALAKAERPMPPWSAA
jgi:ketosteroid isomerase-like protein